MAWSDRQLGDLVSFENGDRGSGYPRPGDYVLDGIPFINATQLSGGTIAPDPASLISEEAFQRLRSGRVRRGDLLFCLRGSPGKLAMVLKPPGAIASSLVIIRANPGVDQQFLYYALSTPELQRSVKALDNGSAQPNVSVRALRELLVPTPPLPTQTAIASLLAALDDKIELNRRMSETLERMARALYDSWVSGAGSGAALDYVGTVGNIVEFDPPTPIRRGEERPYLGLAELPTIGPVHAPPTPRGFSSGARFRNLDTLLARITPSLENGKACIANGIPGDGLAWGSTELIVMRPRPGVPFSLPYLIARDEGFRALAIQNMTGTSGRQRVPRAPLQQARLPTPDTSALARFGELVDPMFEAVFCRAREADTLAEIRDTLLPRLISGELRIPEAEQFVSEVT